MVFRPSTVMAQTRRIMRITALLLLGAALHVSATGLSQKVTLSLDKVPVQKVFTEVFRQTGVSIVYQESLFSALAPVSIHVKDATVQEVLDKCLSGQPFDYSFEGNLIVIKQKTGSTLKSADSLSTTPPIDIRGHVTDSLGNPLVGASVTVKGSKKGTVTDANGDFALPGVKDNAVLVISYTGYTSKQLKVNGNNAIAVFLDKSHSLLDEVQIIAYGTTTVRLNTGDISTVTNKVIEEQPISNPLEALEGRMPGVYIQQTSGVSGGGFNIQILGQNSLRNTNGNNGNLPFYIVDGVPFSSSSLDANTLVGGSIVPLTSPLNSINPSDIASIEVLKDADATAIYGSRGANGVVLITTKKGKAGKTKFDLTAYQGAGKVTRMMNLLNTPQYLSMRIEALKNSNLWPVDSSIYQYIPDVFVWDTSRYTNWQKSLIGGTAHTTNVQASISGGSSNTQFLLSGGYFNQSTVFPGNFNDQKGSKPLFRQAM
jgi:TonB-dependent SusC/RagA subfamily outer membrane receptor